VVFLSSDNSSVECGEQIKRFGKLTSTNRSDWETSEVKYNAVFTDAQGRHIYEFSDNDTKDFDKIKPFFDYLEKVDPQRLQRIKKEHKENHGVGDVKAHNKWWYSCQFCGHGIMYQFKIKNVKRKLKMVIGSHCVKRFKNVEPVIDLIRQRTEQTVRNAMKGWIKSICNDIWNNPKFARISYMRDGKEKFIPKQKYINFAKMLNELDVDSLSFTELKKIFRTAEKLKLQLPIFVEEILHPRLSKQKTEHDEFFWS